MVSKGIGHFVVSQDTRNKMFGKIHTWMMVFCACFGAMRSGEMSTQTNSTIASLAKVDVAFCLAVKVVCDVDVEDLIEWIDYHAALGVGKFYVMDHNSSVSITQGLWYGRISSPSPLVISWLPGHI